MLSCILCLERGQELSIVSVLRASRDSDDHGRTSSVGESAYSLYLGIDCRRQLKETAPSTLLRMRRSSRNQLCQAEVSKAKMLNEALQASQ